MMVARKKFLIPAMALFLACADLALESDRTPISIDISPRGGLYLEGESEKLKVEVRDQNGELMPVPSWAPKWRISDATIAEVAADGTMTAVGGGEVVVVAEVAGMAAATRFRMNPSQVRLSLGAVYLNQVAQNKEGHRFADSRATGSPAGLRGRGPDQLLSPQRQGQAVPRGRGGLPRGVPAHGRLDFEDDRGVESPGLVQRLRSRPPRPARGRNGGRARPEGLVPLAPGSQTRYPQTGTMALDVVAPPPLRQIFVPTFAALTPDQGVHGWTDGLNPDSPSWAWAGRSCRWAPWRSRSTTTTAQGRT